MKSSSKKQDLKGKTVGFLAVLLLPMVSVVWWGCQTKVAPVGAYPAPNNSPNYSLVTNFKGNFNPTPEPTNQTNSHLLEVQPNGNLSVVNSPGIWSVVNNFTGLNQHGVPYENGSMVITGGGPNGAGDNALFVTGYVNDTADGTYPGIELEGLLDNNPPSFNVPSGQKSAYNASFFSGVQFYINIKPDDTAAARYFYVATTQESAPPAGTCIGTASAACYNYFGYTFAGPTAGWSQFSSSFTKLSLSYGQVPNPASLTGVNLEEVQYLLWEEGDANGGKSVNVDFAVDDVYFY